MAKVIPVYKSGDSSKPENYRPISILPAVSKIFEMILFEKLNTYLNKYNCLAKEQYGFRKSTSTIDAILNLIKFICEGNELNEVIQAIFLDLSKAFDCIPHALIIAKLIYYGIRGKTLELLISYLENRQQMVYFNLLLSEILMMKTGVPQGSILGPLLFLICINDLPSNIQGNSILFVDDTTFIMKNKTLEDLRLIIDQIMEEAMKWFVANGLTLNSNKTASLLFSNQKAVNTNLNSVKYLGIFIDSKLNWNVHIDKLSGDLSKSTFALRNLKKTVCEKTKLAAYFALFHSKLSYGLLIWGNVKAISRIFTLQKKAVRIISNAASRAHCRPLFIKFKILTIYSQFCYLCLMHVKENLSNFKINSEKHEYDTRSKNMLQIPKKKLNISRNCPEYICVKLYNHLPDRIKNLNNKQFRKVIKNVLINTCLYSHEEFYEIEF